MLTPAATIPHPLLDYLIRSVNAQALKDARDNPFHLPHSSESINKFRLTQKAINYTSKH